MEAEADAMGAKLIAEAGYDPMEMPTIWQQLIGEEQASAAYRGKHRDRGRSSTRTLRTTRAWPISRPTRSS